MKKQINKYNSKLTFLDAFKSPTTFDPYFIGLHLKRFVEEFSSFSLKVVLASYLFLKVVEILYSNV